MRIVFAGTPDFAVPCLDAALAAGHQVVAVYTQPDRPAGRGRALTASPVKQRALAAGVPVEQPENFKTVESRQRLAAYRPDLMIVVAYGLILSQKVLDIPQHGCWNVHASLLPRWRGAAPIQRAIAAGDTETGVCLMRMEKGLDTGPVYLRRALSIATVETGGSLHDKLAALGADLVTDGLQRLAAGALPLPETQSEMGVEYAHKLDKREAVLDLERPALELERQVRAFSPWPVAELTLGGERLRVHAAKAVPSTSRRAPGEIVQADREGIDVATGDGVLRLVRVQREGGRPVSAQEYLNARNDLLRRA
ncbi:MAG TPA: methionyl-tRNA formyltransferase [Pseudomonadota bacterium]|nr:methionyl-tRNA formyltransferase [Pseudomonadota bacterium]